MGGPTDGTSLQSGGPGVRFAAITDGLSNTLLVGDKHVPPNLLRKGELDNSAYNGDYFLSHARPAGTDYPLAQSFNEMRPVFGSYHTGVVQFGFCDGSVRALPQSIDPNTLGLMACRDDGQPIPDY